MLKFDHVFDWILIDFGDFSWLENLSTPVTDGPGVLLRSNYPGGKLMQLQTPEALSVNLRMPAFPGTRGTTS